MSKPARTKRAKTTDKPVERLLHDGTEEFNELVNQRLHELLFESDISTLRKKRGWTQAMLAERAEVKQPFIARIESGSFKNVEIRTLIRIAAALNASLEIRLTDNERVPVERRAHT